MRFTKSDYTVAQTREVIEFVRQGGVYLMLSFLFEIGKENESRFDL